MSAVNMGGQRKDPTLTHPNCFDTCEIQIHRYVMQSRTLPSIIDVVNQIMWWTLVV